MDILYKLNMCQGDTSIQNKRKGQNMEVAREQSPNMSSENGCIEAQKETGETVIKLTTADYKA